LSWDFLSGEFSKYILFFFYYAICDDRKCGNALFDYAGILLDLSIKSFYVDYIFIIEFNSFLLSYFLSIASLISSSSIIFTSSFV
jgi:hypothetical protein